MPKYKVSVLCLTYNHINYIEKSLKSIVDQKTNFEFEIIINDDASNDGTSEFIKDFVKKNKKVKITHVLHKKNKYSSGERGILIKYILPKATGEYIAICEGDDYWINENKLQEQSDFLDKNKEYTVVFNKSLAINSNGDIVESRNLPSDDEDDFSINRLFERNFIQTNSVMYRKINYSKITKESIMPADWYLNIYHARAGEIKYINKPMSAYRVHEGGIWSGWDSDEKHRINHFKKNGRYIAKFYSLLYKETINNDKLLVSLNRNVYNFLKSLYELGLVNEFLRYQNDDIHFSELLLDFIVNEKHNPKLVILENKNTILQSKINNMSKNISLRDNKIKKYEEELNNIYNSRSWKATSSIRKIRSKK